MCSCNSAYHNLFLLECASNYTLVFSVWSTLKMSQMSTCGKLTISSQKFKSGAPTKVAIMPRRSRSEGVWSAPGLQVAVLERALELERRWTGRWLSLARQGKAGQRSAASVVQGGLVLVLPRCPEVPAGPNALPSRR